ncbi:MAG: class I SAM-dependent methyltransferase [Planctomycetes bacterium]|nr:class I SAM-dependent methyltransferase [Planctomycetota bacterium]
MPQRSKIDITGASAKYYDAGMDLLFMGGHRRFMRTVLRKMGTKPGDEILDMGSGTGRNASLMIEMLGSTGRILGIDIGQEMLRQSRQRCHKYPNAEFIEASIKEPLDFDNKFDKACLFFVLHGFEDEAKKIILENAFQALKPSGRLWILDYAEFDLDRLLFPLRWIFTHFECELASEFLELDLQAMLKSEEFTDFVSHPMLGSYLRLLEARKPGSQKTHNICNLVFIHN